MTTVTITERKHGGHGAIFELDGQRYYVPTCCGKAEVEITDEDTRQCRTTCPNHGETRRQYDPALTDDERAEIAERLNTEVAKFNPASDPHGERQQRRRKSGSTTHLWYASRGM